MKTLTLIAASAALLIGAGAATAEDLQTSVRYNPADLATAAGQAAVHAEIEAAAREVCVVDDMRDLELRAQRRACIADAVENAEAQLRQKIADAGLRYYARAESQPNQG